MKTGIQLLKEKFDKVGGQLVASDFDELFEIEKKAMITAHHDGQMYGVRNSSTSTGEAVKYIMDNYPIHNPYKP